MVKLSALLNRLRGDRGDRIPLDRVAPGAWRYPPRSENPDLGHPILSSFEAWTWATRQEFDEEYGDPLN